MAFEPFTFSPLYRKTITHSSTCIEHNSYANLINKRSRHKQKNIVFRKLISNLPYSPTLITEVGFYAGRLRDEDVTRRVTVLFVVLALIVQSLAVFSPPESANASSEQDIIRGGVSDLNDFLTRYDHNENDVKDIYSAVGVSRSEIAAARPGTISSTDNTYMMSRYGQLSSASKEISLSYQRSVGGVGVRYFSPISVISGPNQSFNGWVGQSAALGWFGIIQASGSLATRDIPTTFTPYGADAMQAFKKISAQNLTQGASSESVAAKPLDKLSYTLQLSNSHPSTVSGGFSIRIADVLEYATLIDTGGGSFDQENGILNWPSVELAPGQTQKQTFVIQILSDLPSTGKGVGNPESYDCKLSAVFGNAHITQVNCPPAKDFEAVLSQLPGIGIGGNLLFITILLIVVLFFAIRTSQLKKELRIIRHNFNTGII